MKLVFYMKRTADASFEQRRINIDLQETARLEREAQQLVWYFEEGGMVL